MKKNLLMKLVLAVTLFCIFLPMAVVLIWSITGRWPWPELLPESYTLRTVEELFFGSSSLPKLLLSSISLALTVGILGTVIGILTARATELYSFRGKAMVYMGSFFPLLVPGTVFAMGIQITGAELNLDPDSDLDISLDNIEEEELVDIYTWINVSGLLAVFFAPISARISGS